MKQTDFTYIKMRNKGQDVRDKAVFHAQNKRQQIKKEKLFASPFGMKSRDLATFRPQTKPTKNKKRETKKPLFLT